MLDKTNLESGSYSYFATNVFLILHDMSEIKLQLLVNRQFLASPYSSVKHLQDFAALQTTPVLPI